MKLLRLHGPLVLGGSLLFLAVAEISGQTSDDGAARADQRNLCFHPGPLAQCQSFMLTEMSLLLGIASTSETVALANAPKETFRALGSHVSWQLGYLWNLTVRDAVGASVLAGYGGPEARYGVRMNYRHWLDGRSSLDVAAGALKATVDGLSQRSGSGLTVDLRYTYNDRYAVTVRAERLSTDRLPIEPAGFHEFPDAHALYVGITLGTEPALWGTAASVAAGLLYLVAYALAGPYE